MLQEQVQGNWRSSSYAIIISHKRISMYQIQNCIEDMLNTNEFVQICSCNDRDLVSNLPNNRYDRPQPLGELCLPWKYS